LGDAKCNISSQNHGALGDVNIIMALCLSWVVSSIRQQCDDKKLTTNDNW